MKYLEQNDSPMHTKARELIRQECSVKNKEGIHASFSTSIQSHLKNLVGKNYWKKAEEHLRDILCAQYSSKDGMTQEYATKKAEEGAKSAAEPLGRFYANDVICGRGYLASSHPGNLNFWSLIDQIKMNCTATQRKPTAMMILNEIKSMNPPGRFVEKNEVTQSWDEIEKKEVFRKVSQALHVETE